MFHLQVHGCSHHSHDVAFPQVESGRVHEVQEDTKPLRVDLRIQIDDTKVAFQLVGEDAVEQATVKQTKVPLEWSQSTCALCLPRAQSPKLRGTY